MKKLSLKFNNKFFGSLAQALKKYPSLYLLSLFLITLISAGFIYYLYITKEPALNNEVLNKNEIKTGVYQRIDEGFQQRQDNIRQEISKEYPNIFR